MRDQEAARFALMYGLMAAVISAAIGYFIAKQISPSKALFRFKQIRPKTAHQYGMQGFAYALLIVFVNIFPKVIIKQDLNSVAVLVLHVVLYGLVAYGIGGAYGYFRLNSNRGPLK